MSAATEVSIGQDTLALYRLDTGTLGAIRYIATTTELNLTAEERLERIRRELARHAVAEAHAAASGPIGS